MSDSEEKFSAEYGPNLYWPGDFEARFEGGIFGSKRNIQLCDSANRTPGGHQSWKLASGYQHLELLVPSHRKGIVSFWTLAAQPQTLIFKVVDPLPGVPVTKETPVHTRDQTIEITASTEWQRHEIAFETGEAWPKPPVSEILLTFFHIQGQPVFIDDLEVRMASDPAATPATLRPIAAMADTSFFDGLTFGTTAPHKTSAIYSLNADVIRGHRVRISADVTYLSMDDDIQNWGSILFVLARGHATDAPIIEPEGEWPFWAPIGHAAPVGQPRRISADYLVSTDAEALSLRVIAQPGIGPNTARIKNVTFEIIE